MTHPTNEITHQDITPEIMELFDITKPTMKLARKLGYRNEKEYRYVRWKKK